MIRTDGWIPAPSRAKNSLRTAAALGCALVALAGCGGGSDDAAQPPVPSLAAPANFKVRDFGFFGWDATPGATRYELFVDTDGSGPLAEIKADDFNQTTNSGFTYSQAGAQSFAGSLHGTAYMPTLAASLNTHYRLRACNASGCGAFTDSRPYDVVNAVSHEFASGRVPTNFSNGLDVNPRLSKDGLTLTIGRPRPNSNAAVYVFTRSSSNQPWAQQAMLSSGKSYFGQVIALSADGNTLAIQSMEPTGSDANALTDVVYLYQRSGSDWTQQARLTPPSTPPTCTPSCKAALGSQLALSSDGNVLAASVLYSTSAGSGSTAIGAVVTYARSNATWSQQAYLETGGTLVSALSLAGDGKTLAVNEGALDPLHGAAALASTTPFVRIFAQPGNGTWSQQARIPAGLVHTVDLTGSRYSTMALNHDGSTLAVHGLNVPGHTTPELSLKPSDLSCGSLAADGWYMTLFARNGNAWQRQAAISRGLEGSWALASDGNGLFYGNALFTRSNSAWACP